MGDDPERPNLVARLAGRGARPHARLPQPRRHRLRRPAGLDARPLVRRRPRRPPVGPRRARHEVPDRRRGGGRRDAGPRGLAPRPRRAEAVQRRRRGGRRRDGRPVAHHAAPGRRPLRLPRQRGRRPRDALRRPPAVRRLLRGEGDVPLRRARPRPGRPRLAAGDRRQRAAEARARARAPRRAPAAVRRHGGAAPLHGGARRGPGRPAGGDRAPARGRAAPGDHVRADAPRHRRADDRLGLGEDQRDPRPRRAARRLPHPARHGGRADDGAPAPRCSTASTASSSSSPSRSWATARRSTRR